MSNLQCKVPLSSSAGCYIVLFQMHILYVLKIIIVYHQLFIYIKMSILCA